MSALPLCVAALLAALSFASAVRACEPIPQPGTYDAVDRPIAVFSDGSFRDASRDDEWAQASGRPVRDIGGGRVGQVVDEDWGNCATDERLIFVDCTAGEAILVHGQPRQMTTMEMILGGTRESTLLLQPPHGPLALTLATSVAEVAALAAREGWTVETNVPGFAAARGPQNAFNPFFGCRIFYPGSVGAGR